jgi:alpha-glucosidase
LLPFLYTTLEEAHRTGVPLFRPLLLEFQDDPTALNLDDQFMVGSALLAAPVLRAGERAREVYLPAGLWYDYWTGAAQRGGDLLRVDAPLDRLPLFVRGGSIVPSTVAMNHTGEKPWNPLRFDVYPDADGAATGSLYEDDGLSPAYQTGVFRRTALRLVRAAGGAQLTLDTPAGSFQPAARRFELALHASARFTAVTLDGRPLSGTTAATSAAGWFRESPDVLVIRLEDDGRPHTFELH